MPLSISPYYEHHSESMLLAIQATPHTEMYSGASFWVLTILGGIVFFAGIGLRHLIKRRKFYRRNASGLEQFSSYSKNVFIPFLEKVFNLIATILIIAGGLFFFGGILMKWTGK